MELLYDELFGVYEYVLVRLPGHDIPQTQIHINDDLSLLLFDLCPETNMISFKIFY